MFPMDAAVTVELDGTPDKKKGISAIRGWKKDHYVILDIPTHEGRAVFLHLHRDYIFRYVDEGIYTGFRSWVIDTIFKPYPVLFIRYPTEIERRSLRSFPRYRLHLKIRFTAPGGKGIGELHDLSLQGCLLATRDDILEMGQSVDISIRLPGSHSIQDLRGSVRNIGTRSGEILAGIAFHHTPEMFTQFVNLVAQLTQK